MNSPVPLSHDLPRIGMALQNDGLPPLPDRKPSVSTRTFHWQRVDRRKLQETLWIKKDLAKNTADIEIDTSKIESLFKILKRGLPVGGVDGSPSASPKRPVEISFISDAKRKQGISIFLGFLRMSNDDVRRTIVKLDERHMVRDNLRKLIENIPLPEERQLLQDYDGEISMLSPADQFLFTMCSIPRLEHRLRTWLFKLSLEDKLGDIVPSILTLKNAAQELQESSKWLKLLQIILAVGNFLNGTGSKGNYHGFKITSLSGLKGTKANDGKISLLQYIVSFLDERYPDVLSFTSELEHVDRSKRVSIDVINEEKAKIERSLQHLEAELEKNEKSPAGEDDKYQEVMRKFHTQATERVSEFQQKYLEMVEQLNGLALFYGEDQDELAKQPSEFLSMIQDFMNDFRDTLTKLNKDKRAEEMRLARESRANLSPLSSSRRSPAKRDIDDTTTEDLSSEDTNGFGVLTSLSKGIYDGNALRQRRMQRKADRQDSSTKSNIGGLDMSELQQVLLLKRLKTQG